MYFFFFFPLRYFDYFSQKFVVQRRLAKFCTTAGGGGDFIDKHCFSILKFAFKGVSALYCGPQNNQTCFFQTNFALILPLTYESTYGIRT